MPPRKPPPRKKAPPPKRPTGRPSKLTKERGEAIAADIERGLFVGTACEANGIDRSTYKRWMATRENFRAIIKKSEAILQRDQLERVKIGGKDWVSAAWLLERRFPNEWAIRIKRAILDREDELLRLLRDELDPATYAKVIGVLAGAGANGAEEAAEDAEDGTDPPS